MTKPIKHVLWATDFSDESKEALAYADFFTKAFKAKLTALHVVPDFAPALYEAWPEVQAELAGQIEASKINAKIKLDQMCETQGVCPNKVIIAEGARRPRSSSGRPRRKAPTSSSSAGGGSRGTSRT